MTRELAIELLRKGSGTHFDPAVVDLFIEHLPRFEAEITARGLEAPKPTNATDKIEPSAYDVALARENAPVTAYDQIRNAHREVYALYEIARTFALRWKSRARFQCS